MTGRLVPISPPAGGMYRLARGPGGPFTPPDWDRAHDDGTFGNRFDDPTEEEGNSPKDRFRAIYCATNRVATLRRNVSQVAAWGADRCDDDGRTMEQLNA